MQNSVSAIVIKVLQNTLDKGGTIEIPSLQITITKKKNQKPKRRKIKSPTKSERRYTLEKKYKIPRDGFVMEKLKKIIKIPDMTPMHIPVYLRTRQR
jgi:hypothetical protein